MADKVKKTDLDIRKEIIKEERLTTQKNRQYRLSQIRQKFAQAQSQKRETSRKEDVLESKIIPADDLFQAIYRKERLIEPTYSFSRLYEIYEQSDILQACVDTYQENIDGFGFQCQFLGDDTKGEDKSNEAKRQLQVMEDFFGYANHEQSWTSLRKEIREDLIVLGNGGIEIVRNKKGAAQIAFPVPFSYIRLARLPAKPRTITVTIKRGGKDINLRIKKKFRRYAQIDEFGKKLRWFKEFGDDRPMDADTGKYTNVKNPATELWHIKTAYNGQAYGLPSWVSAVPQVIGRTNANYVNYDLFESQGIPPMAILISGGTLTDESLDDLESFLDGMRGATNWNRIMILETEVEGLGIDEKGHAKLELKNLTDYRQDDQMFEKYLKTTEKDVRKRLRLPPIYVGGTDVYTLACYSADTQTLTENGWKYYWEVDSGERIATINPDTKNLEYHIPEKLYVYSYDGEMIHICCQKADCLITPNHELWIANANSKLSIAERKWGKHPAESIEHRQSRDFVTQVAPREPHIFDYSDSLLKNVPNGILLTWAGIILGDGSIDKIGNRIRIGIKKKRKVEFFTNITQDLVTYLLDADLLITNQRKRDGYRYIDLKSPSLHQWCVDNLLDENWSKVLNKALYSEAMFNGLMKSDGTWGETRNSGAYTTTIESVADSFQILALSLGYRTMVNRIVDPRPNRSDIFMVTICKNSELIMNKKDHIVRVPYNGLVYCFHVENHLFITRRNGKVAIHGNTAKASQTIAEEQVFIPKRRDIDELINIRIVQNELGITLWKYKSRGPTIVGAQEISSGVEKFGKAGAFTINHAISMANEAFGLEMSKFREPWADYPLAIVLELAKMGQLKGLEKLTGELEKESPKLPAPQQQLMLPEMTEKMFRTKETGYSETERVLYSLMTSVKKALEEVNKCEAETQL